MSFLLENPANGEMVWTASERDRDRKYSDWILIKSGPGSKPKEHHVFDRDRMEWVLDSEARRSSERKSALVARDRADWRQDVDDRLAAMAAEIAELKAGRGA